jgi:hypothetical protein
MSPKVILDLNESLSDYSGSGILTETEQQDLLEFGRTLESNKLAAYSKMKTPPSRDA